MRATYTTLHVGQNQITACSLHMWIYQYLLLFLMRREVFITSLSKLFLLLFILVWVKYEISWLWVLPMIGQLCGQWNLKIWSVVIIVLFDTVCAFSLLSFKKCLHAVYINLCTYHLYHYQFLTYAGSRLESWMHS